MPKEQISITSPSSNEKNNLHIHSNQNTTYELHYSESPLVSIIIPTYNSEDYIKRCITSCVNQTYEYIEIIVINDGSTDQTESILHELQLSHINLFVVSTKNQGQGSARNLALDSYAKGNYVLFLDSDDTLTNDCVEILIQSALEFDSDVTISDWEMQNYTGEIYRGSNFYRFINGPILNKTNIQNLFTTPYFTVGKLLKRSFLEKAKIRYGEGYIYEDVEFYVGILTLASRISYVPNSLYKVIIHKKSTTKSNFSSDIHAVSFLRALSSTINTYKSNLGEYSIPFLTHMFSRVKLYSIVEKRIPRKFWSSFVNNFFTIISQDFPEIENIENPIKIRLPYKIWRHNKKLGGFLLLTQALFRKR